MTLNIWNVSEWRARRGEIVAWIERLDPDLMCLQEVVELPDGRNQARWLAEATGRHAGYGAAVVGNDGWSFGNAVLSRWPIESTTVHRLPFEPRPDDDQRVAVHVRTAGIDVFCTHLNWRLEDGIMREAQVQELVRIIEREADPQSPLPPILAGDMNAEPDSTEIRFLTGLTSLDGRSAFFQDSWRVAGGAGPGWTWDNRNSFAVHDREPSRRIDYVLVGWRRDDGAGVVESARVVCDRALTGTFASDHFGLLSEITTTDTTTTTSRSGVQT